MAAIDDVTAWTIAFRKSRNLISEGSPLWAYKVTDDELSTLRKAFKRLFASLTPHTVFNRYINRIDKPLVIYMATWLQRNTHGRAKWEMVTSSIGLKYDNSTRFNLIECVKSGLEKWGLSVHVTTNNRYLDTLYCHGGFPRSDMLGICNSHLMDYFERVLRHYASYLHSSELQVLANNELSTLPESLQQEPFSRLTISLIEFLIELRDEFHLYDCSDPLVMLETKQPGWKDNLPFLMIDEEAEVLVNKLLNKTSKVVRRSQYPVRLKRYLKLKNDCFSLNAEVYVNHTIHPEDLSSVFGGMSLPDYYELATYTAEGKRYRTASFSYRTGAAPRWMVSTLENTITNEGAIGELSYQLFADGESFGSGLYYCGESLEINLPWFFEDKTGELSYVSQGSYRSKEQSLYVVCDAEPTNLSPLSSCEKLGTLHGIERDIYKVCGHLKIESMFGDFHVRTNESQKLNSKITVQGKRFDKVLSESPSYTGKPNLILNDESLFEKEEFFWINKSKEKIGYYSGDNIFGEGSIVWVCDGEVRWVHQCLLLPEEFDVELIHIEQGNFEAKFFGIQNAKIGMGYGQEAWLAEEPEEYSGFYFLDINVPSLMSDYVSFRLFWDNDLNTEILLNIPIQIESAVLIDRQNLPYRTLEMGRVTIEDLNKLNLIINADLELSVVRVKADLMNQDKLIATVSSELNAEPYSGKYKVSGRNISNLAIRLFRHGTVPDNTVKLTFYANNHIIESQIPTIHRYKQILEQQNGENRLLLDKIPKLQKEQSDLTLKMSPIWDLEREPIILKSALSNDSKIIFELPEVSEYGTWLFWSSTTTSLRPRVVEFKVPMLRKQDKELGGLGQLLKAAINNDSIEKEYVESLEKDSLEHAVKYLKYNQERSSFDFRKIDGIINEMSLNIDHQGWPYIENILLKIDEIEPDTFHVIKRLMYCNKALTLFLLKNSDSFSKVWELSDRLPFEWTTIPISAWQSAITIVREKKSKAFHSIRDTAPLVYEEIVNQLFSPLADKGKYFSTVIEVALGNYKSQKEIWSDTSNDKNLIGKQFLEARANLYSSHENKLMKISQSRWKDDELIKQVESTWPKAELPPELKGFFKKPPLKDTRSDVVVRAQKLTTELPILLAFYNMGMFEGRLPGWAWNYLSFLLSQLQQFDRQWLQQSMSLAIGAAYTCFQNADWQIVSDASQDIKQEVDND